MDLRAATAEDVSAIRSVARASLVESYGHALSADVIDEAVERWYASDDLTREITDTATVFPVAVENGEVVGFAESYVVDRREPVGEIDWLHVHPDHRGEGVGTQLLARVEERLREEGVDRIEGRVLVANEAGTRFYEREGYDQTGERTVDVGNRTFRERLYSKRLTEAEAFEAETVTTADGDRVYVAYEEAFRGSQAPFYAVYEDTDHEEQWGFVCSDCGSLDVAVDTMDRLECTGCGNRRKPTRWDAAYL